MLNEMTPLFLFSLPRSGSTLTQKILATHQDITTVGEPWILLPYLYTLKEQGIYTEYGHHILVKAIKEFCQELPHGQQDYHTEIRSLALNLYAKAAKKPTKYFLDKTPRYALVAEEIINLFPDAKFIILWRNPLAVAASMITTWSNNKWNLYRYRIDLFDGLANLITVAKKYQKQVHTIQYESLLSQPELELKKLCNYLQIPFQLELLSSFSQTNINQNIGDPIGIKKYKNLSQEPLEKWKTILTNPIRKTWSNKYLNWIGQERLEIMGYSQEKIINELNEIPFSLNSLAFDTHRILRRTIKKPKDAWNVYHSVLIKD